VDGFGCSFWTSSLQLKEPHINLNKQDIYFQGKASPSLGVVHRYRNDSNNKKRKEMSRAATRGSARLLSLAWDVRRAVLCDGCR